MTPLNAAGWATPTAHEFEPRDVDLMVRRRERLRKKHGNGNGFGLTLGQQVHLEIWLSPEMEKALIEHARKMEEKNVG